MKKICTFLILIAVTISAEAQLPHEFGRFKKIAHISENPKEYELVKR